jgi:signal transduction histidine kinase
VRTDFRRYGADIETPVYFCCLEAIPNAEEHAGPDAAVEFAVVEDGGVLESTVTGMDSGFHPVHASERRELVDMSDGIAALAGHPDIRADPGCGTAACGRVPPP